MKKFKGHSDEHIPLGAMVDYRDGLLSERECHRIEKHLLNCPLCEEAMEGLEHYPGSKSFIRDVETLKSRIDRRTRGARVKRRVKMLSVAATILVLISLGVYFSITGIDTGKGNQIAEKKTEQQERSAEKPAAETSKLNAFETKTDSIQAHLPEQYEPVEINADKEEEEVVSAPAEKPQLTIAENTMKETTGSFSEADVSVEKAVVEAGPAGIINGTVVDEQGEPVPYANVKVEGQPAGSVSDENGKFKIEVPEGAYKLAVTTVGMTPASVPVSTGETVRVVLETENIAMNDIVVTESRAMEAEKSLEKKTKPEQDNKSMPVPAGGEKKLEKYLAKNLRYPEAALKNNVSGKVTVEFWVHDDGSVSDIKVLNGLGSGCDEEAVRLIKNGPKWKPGKVNGAASTMKRTVAVWFRLPNK